MAFTINAEFCELHFIMCLCLFASPMLLPTRSPMVAAHSTAVSNKISYPPSSSYKLQSPPLPPTRPPSPHQRRALLPLHPHPGPPLLLRFHFEKHQRLLFEQACGDGGQGRGRGCYGAGAGVLLVGLGGRGLDGGTGVGFSGSGAVYWARGGEGLTPWWPRLLRFPG